MNSKRIARNQLSEEEIRKKIIIDISKGRDIQEIAAEHRYHPKSVQRINRTFHGRRSYKRRKGAGRPQKLGPAEKVSLLNKIRAKPWLSCKDIVTELDLQVSPETVRRYLKSLGYIYKNPTKKPKLSQTDRAARFTWANAHKNFDFSNVVFADEASFWLNGSSKKMWIQKEEEYLAETIAHPAKVHVWGQITGDGIMTIETFRENLDSNLLISIMEGCLVREVNARYGKGRWILAFDNDPKHRAGKTLDFLEKAKVIFFLFFSPLR